MHHRSAACRSPAGAGHHAHVDILKSAPLLSSSLEPLYVRPIELDDEDAFETFLGTLTDDDLVDRFGRPIGRTDPAIKRFLFHSSDKLMGTLGAFRTEGPMIGTILIGAVTPKRAEIALIVAAHVRSMGVGRRLVGAITIEAERKRFETLQAHVAWDNQPAVCLARTLRICPEHHVRSPHSLRATHSRIVSQRTAELA